jgi:hypothetical protein
MLAHHNYLAACMQLPVGIDLVVMIKGLKSVLLLVIHPTSSHLTGTTTPPWRPGA